MGMLDGQIRKAIAKGFKGKLRKGQLRKVVAAGRNPANGDPLTTVQQFKCEGFADNYSEAFRAQAGIPETDVEVTLIAGLTGAEPTADDKVVLAGKWYQLRKIKIDPAGATYACQAFEVKAPA